MTSFRFHHWQIELISESPELESAVQQYLSPRWLDDAASQPPAEKVIKLRFLGSGNHRPSETVRRRSGRIARKFQGLMWELDFAEREIKLYRPRGTISPSLLFHVGFLQPLGALLNAEKAGFLHGALASQKGRGVLLLGPSGAGKSSLSLQLSRHGFRYYSDECSFVRITETGCVGLPFPTQISIRPPIPPPFQPISNQFHWDSQREKMSLDPLGVWPDTLGNSCDIKLVVFPHFEIAPPVFWQPLEADLALESLLQDDFFAFHRFFLRDPACLARSLEIMEGMVRHVRFFQAGFNFSNIDALREIISQTLSD